MSSSPWFWRFNPRFYRGTRPNTFTKYLYWIFGYEILAMALIGLFVWWIFVPMAKRNVERRNREIERGRRERLGLPVDSNTSPITKKDIVKDSPSQPLTPEVPDSSTGETSRETR